ncbi:MAG: DUF4326 domain-containing protein [Alphaproteobacteria bacterium]
MAGGKPSAPKKPKRAPRRTPRRMPKRIQVRRTKGFRLPTGTVYVGRPTKWGNPYRPGPHLTREEMVARYRNYLLSNRELMAALDALRGHDLACWCRLDEACHADVLLELANRSARRKSPAP